MAHRQAVKVATRLSPCDFSLMVLSHADARQAILSLCLERNDGFAVWHEGTVCKAFELTKHRRSNSSCAVAFFVRRSVAMFGWVVKLVICVTVCTVIHLSLMLAAP